ncbi:hypothetical protein WUBG_05544, partial [Wuchereria bancrofti]
EVRLKTTLSCHNCHDPINEELNLSLTFYLPSILNLKILPLKIIYKSPFYTHSQQCAFRSYVGNSSTNLWSQNGRSLGFPSCHLELSEVSSHFLTLRENNLQGIC